MGSEVPDDIGSTTLRVPTTPASAAARGSRLIRVALVALPLGLVACQADSSRDRALVGGALGAGTGAVIGSVAGQTRGAVVGGVIGGATGAIVGAATTPRNCVDRYGRAVVCP
jgi:hypothetical protein